ncbi:hypothetical protein ABZT16_11760 [Streptomyces flaveolus]|uniref:hypothetical protein n=1 Tax=Streptomyces flaveolus TaxID=67297 RepID=UPI0033A70120
MDERRPDTSAVDPSVRAELSPLQRAWAAYRDHTARCKICRSVDGGRCETALVLWRAHQDECDDAYRRLADEVS